MTQREWTIGEAAAQTGLSDDALRYYEREGLVGPIDRDAAGRRRYREGDLAWISVVTCMRDAGLGIADLRRFTELLRSSDEPEERTEFLLRRRAELVARRDALSAAIVVLDDKIDHFAESESP